MKYYFITNPAAGKTDSCDVLVDAINTACRAKGVEYEIYKTSCVGDATRYVKEVCQGAHDEELVFFACGGDGTFNEVISGAVGFDKVSVGLIPKGSGNDFVRNFSNKELFLDISAQLDGECVRTDVLKLNDKYAINMVNIGFDCEVVKVMMKIKRSPLVPSGLAYIFGLVFTLIKKPGVVAEISIDKGEYKPHKLLLTTIANGCYCGGGFHSNPHALLTDGKLNFLFINNLSRIKFVSLVSSYKAGTHIVPKNAKLLSSGSCHTVDFRFPGVQSISIDGEVNDIDKELHFEVIHNGIGFMIPKGSDFLKSDARKEAEKVSV